MAGLPGESAPAASAPCGLAAAGPPLTSAPSPRAAGWSDEARGERRGALRRVLDAAVAGNAEGAHYYQGLHDVAAVLLFVCGEAAAYRLLRALLGCHLRDCARPDLAAAIEALRLLYPLLQQARWGGWGALTGQGAACGGASRGGLGSTASSPAAQPRVALPLLPATLLRSCAVRP